MPFNSLLFIAFCTIFILLYFGVPGKYQPLMLLTGSTVFYGIFSPFALAIMLLIVLLFYKGGQFIEGTTGSRRKFLFTGLVSSIILILLFYRLLPAYSTGNQETMGKIFGFQGITTAWFIPLGLSYISFSGLSYLIDIKREKIAASRKLLPFFSFFLYFPKVTQGPIERPAAGLVWFEQSHRPDYNRITSGLKLVTWGFFKKVAIADRLAVIVGTVYATPQDYSGIALLIATLAFSVQIYADFSGYTDIAIGISRMLGIDLTQNFNRPYFSLSIRDFWRRWHITLSNWLRDYLFLPVAYWCSRKLTRERYFGIKSEQWIYLIATMITFAICGLWHGMGWTFLAWGLLFGFYLSAEMFLTGWRKRIFKLLHLTKRDRTYVIFQTMFTFMLITIAWVFFRASSLGDAWQILSSFTAIPHELITTIPVPGKLNSILSGLGVTRTEMIITIFLILFLFSVEKLQKEGSFDNLQDRLPKIARWSFYYLVLFMILFFGAFNANQNFIYAQF